MMKGIMIREKLLEREKEIFRFLQSLIEKPINVIIVGGYAVATHKKRFSVDLDVVVREEDLPVFEKFCEREGYLFEYDKEIELQYGEKFKRFAKDVYGLKASIDVLINGLVSRATNATWSFEYIKTHAIKQSLQGLTFLTPEKELLIAMKMHAGRLSDIRDIVALFPADIQKIELHLMRGDIKKLKEVIQQQEIFLKKAQFDDGFKGVFGVHVYNLADVEETKKCIKNLLAKM